MPRWVRKAIKLGPRRVRASSMTRNKKKINNPRSSIKPESAPDPRFLMT